MKVANYLNRTDEADDPLAEFEKILKEVAAHPEIEELYFKGNNLTATQLARLAETISLSHPNLNTLDLGTNTSILKGGVPALKKIINEHDKLNFIILDFNKMTDEEMTELLENNSENFNSKIKKIRFIFTCNEFTDKTLELIKGKLSPSSILSIVRSNYRIKDLVLKEKIRKECLSFFEEKSKGTATQESFGNKEKLTNDDDLAPKKPTAD